MSELMSCENLGKAYGPKMLFKSLNLSIHYGDRIGLVGVNGSGKSTLLKILCELELPDIGTVRRVNKAHASYLRYEDSLPRDFLENILRKRLREGLAPPVLNEQKFIDKILHNFGFDNPKQIAAHLTKEAKLRFLLAYHTLIKPDILLFDDPTHSFELETILWLENFLPQHFPSYMVASHDRSFLDVVTNRTIELNSKYPEGYRSEYGSFSNYYRKKTSYVDENPYHQEIVRPSSSFSQTLQPIKLYKKISEIRSSKTALPKNPTQSGTILELSGGKNVSRILLTVKGLGLKITGKLLFQSIHFSLYPGTCLHLVGSKGTGKKSLMKILAGQLEPTEGTIELAEGVKIHYFSPEHSSFDPSMTVLQALSPDRENVLFHGQSIPVEIWAKRFSFFRDQFSFPISALNKGEKARLSIAQLLQKSVDILLLDRPTSDLDIETREVLEKNLHDFTGATIILTSDRFTMKKVGNKFLYLGASDQRGHFYDQYDEWEKVFMQSIKQGNASHSNFLSQKEEEKEENGKEESMELLKMEQTITKKEEYIDFLQRQLLQAETTKSPLRFRELKEQIKQLQSHLNVLYPRLQKMDRDK